MTSGAKHPALPFLRSPEKGKVISSAAAVRLVPATGGFVGIGFAEEIAVAIAPPSKIRRRQVGGVIHEHWCAAAASRPLPA